jgi:hypothetical protein
LLALTTSSVQADAIQSNNSILRLNGLEHPGLDLPDVSRAEEHSDMFSDVLSNSGKHLGFSVTTFREGLRFGLVKPTSANVTQNPEPVSMLLFGTGLAGLGALVRRRRTRH